MSKDSEQQTEDEVLTSISWSQGCRGGGVGGLDNEPEERRGGHDDRAGLEGFGRWMCLQAAAAATLRQLL